MVLLDKVGRDLPFGGCPQSTGSPYLLGCNCLWTDVVVVVVGLAFDSFSSSTSINEDFVNGVF